MALQQIGLDATLNNVPDFTAGINKMNAGVDSFAKNSKDAGKDFGGGFGEIVIGALREIGTLAVQALLKAGQAVAGFVKDSIGLAGDFQANMLEFQSVAGKDVDTKGLEEFHDLFLQIGKELPVSTSDVQQAAIEMVKGGIDPAIIAAGGLRKNIQFAAAAMKGDLVKAAEISSKILGGWSDANATAAQKTEFLTHSQDMLAKAANASATDVEGLSRGIFQSQGIAKTAGVSFDDLTTTLALLAPRFASSAEAGTSVKNMIARLQPTTDPATQAMQRLGLWTAKTGSAFYDAQGNFVGFEQASQLLQESLKGLTKEQQAAALQTIFGNDAMGAAAALADGGGEAYAIMAQKLSEANGVMESAALKQQGFNTSLDNAKGSVETLQIRLGEGLLPILGKLLDNYITPGINAVTTFAESFLKMVPAIAASDDPIQTLLNALKIAAPQFFDTIVAVERVKDAFVAFVGPIAAVVVPALSDLVDWLKTNLPIAAAAAADFWKTTLQPALASVGNFITTTVIPALSTAADWLKVKIPEAAQATADFWKTTLQPALAGVKDFLTTTVFPAFATLADWLKTNIPPAAQATADFWTNTLLPALKKVNDYINGTIFPTFASLADTYLKNVTKASGDFSTSWNDTMLPALTKVGNYIGQQTSQQWAQFNVWVAVVQKTGEFFAAFWNNVLLPGLKSAGDYLSTHLTPFFNDFGAELNNQVGPAIKGIVDWVTKLIGGFDGTSKGIQDNIKWLNDLAQSFRDLKLPAWLQPGSPTPLETGLVGIGAALEKSVLPNLTPFQQGVRDIGTAITEAFSNTDIVDMLNELGKDAMAGFGKGLKAGLKGVMDIVESTANTVEDAFRGAFQAHSPAERMVPIGESIVQGILSGLAAAWPSLTDQLGDLSDDLISSLSDLGTQIQGIIADSFGATASIDRQIAKNLDKFKDVLPQYQQYTQGALKEAQQQAEKFLDPTQGAKFFKMRSDQILEYAKLQKDLADEQQAIVDAGNAQMAEGATQAQQDAAIAARHAAMDNIERIKQQMGLINKAQQAEISQFDANQAAQGNPYQNLIDIIQKLMKDGLPINDSGFGHDLMLLLNKLNGIPGFAAGGAVAAGSPVWVGEQGPELFWPNMAGRIQSQPSMRAGASGGMTYNGQVGNTTNLSMPIYTNMSPNAIQDSMAIMGAALL